MWRNMSQRFDSAEMEASTDPETPASSFWVCFGKCFGKECTQKKGETCFQETVARRENRDAETEARIKEWILDSSLCYGKEFDLSIQSQNPSQNFSDVSDILKCSDFAATAPATSQDGNPLLATEVASNTVNNKERNRDRWKGRVPANPSGTPSIYMPTDVNEAYQAVQNQRRVQPQPPVSLANSRLVSIPSSAARGNNAGRIIWMRRSAVMKRWSSRIAHLESPRSPAPSNIWLVPASCASPPTGT